MAIAEPEIHVPEWTFGERLEKARRDAGLSPEQMAAAMRTTTKSIWNWEHDVRPRRDLVEFAKEWAEATNVPVYWLLGLSTSGYTLDSAAFALIVNPDDALQLSLPFVPNLVAAVHST